MKAAAGFPFWHYTTIPNARSIAADGHIRLEHGDDSLPTLRNVKLAAWFSTNQRYEQTARKAVLRSDGSTYLLTMEELAETHGIARFGFHSIPTLISWEEYKRTSGMPPKVAKGMEEIGSHHSSNHKRWYASYTPVLITPEAMIEQWTVGGGWNRIRSVEELCVPELV